MAGRREVYKEKGGKERYKVSELLQWVDQVSSMCSLILNI